MKEVSASVDFANPKYQDVLKSKFGASTMTMEADGMPMLGENDHSASKTASKQKYSTPSSVKKTETDDE